MASPGFTRTVCIYCGLKAPQGHKRPYVYIEKHEALCPKNPKLTKE